MAYFDSPHIITVEELLKGIVDLRNIPNSILNREVGDVAYDTLSFVRFPSRTKGVKIYISPSPFVNRDGKEYDPNLFIEEAIKQGAKIIIYKPTNKKYKNNHTIFIPIDDPRRVLAYSSVRLYQMHKFEYPFFAVTGTKGKTTTTHILHYLLNKLFGKTGLVGSADYYHGLKKINNLSPEVNGTWLSSLEPLELSGFTHELFKNENGKAMIVEATSHALCLHRVHAKLNICGGIITNIGSDHLDFHKTHLNYVKAKEKLIDLIAESKTAFKKVLILNADDSFSIGFYNKALNKKNLQIVSIGFKESKTYIPCDFYIEYINNQLFFFNNNLEKLAQITAANILTDFNAVNYAMAILLIHKTFNIDLVKILKIVPKFKGVAGRLQTVVSSPYTIIVDNAHEEKSMQSILLYAHKHWKRIITIFSCTGDRDKTKRSIMGELASRLSSYSIITNDSTHTEDPDEILSDIERGFKKNKNYEIIDDRKQAIQKGISLLRKDDLLLVLGMGSESIMDRNGAITPWSDFKTVEEFINDRRKEVMSTHNTISVKY